VRPDIRSLPAAYSGVQHSVAAVMLRSMLFAQASSETCAALATHATSKSVKRGTVLMRQGEAWPFVGLVCEGTVALVGGTAQGRDLLLYEVLPLETFGEIAALDDGATFGNATVISRHAEIVLIPRSAFRRAFAQDAGLARALAQIAAQRIRILVERSTAQVSQPTLARVAAAILPYASPERGMSAALAPLDVLSLADLAVAAGTVREVVGRALVHLERAGAIERRRGRIIQVDRERLTTFL
jgi:CRP/FNR family cyclic AMP-dependent transcriptional regulator